MEPKQILNECGARGLKIIERADYWLAYDRKHAVKWNEEEGGVIWAMHGARHDYCFECEIEWREATTIEELFQAWI